jgi:hypothetical protein
MLPLCGGLGSNSKQVRFNLANCKGCLLGHYRSNEEAPIAAIEVLGFPPIALAV